MKASWEERNPVLQLLPRAAGMWEGEGAQPLAEQLKMTQCFHSTIRFLCKQLPEGRGGSYGKPYFLTRCPSAGLEGFLVNPKWEVGLEKCLEGTVRVLGGRAGGCTFCYSGRGAGGLLGHTAASFTACSLTTV